MRIARLLASLTLAFPLAAYAAKIRVPQDQPTVQAAVDAAQSGDQILVSKGSYAEAVLVDGKQGITIKGKGKPEIVGTGGAPLTILNSSGVTVDGLVLDGAGDNGLLVKDSTSVRIRRCTARNGTNGMRFESGSGHLIEKNVVEDVTSDGIDFDDLGDTIVPTADSIIRKNRVDRAADEGIEVKGAGNLVEKNRVTLSGEDGIGLDGDSTGATIQKNTVDRSGGSGIVAEGVGHRVLKNKIKDTGDEGIQIRGDDHLVEKNKVDRAADDGIDLEDGTNNLVRKNKVKNSGDAGMEIGEIDEPGDTMGNTIEQNKVTGSAEEGLLVRDGGNTFRKNKASKSGTFDLLDESMSGTNVYENNKFGTEQIL